MSGLLFVCDANSARSPLAEAIARELAWVHHLDIEIWSAGARPSHVDPEVRSVLGEVRVSAEGLRSKSLLEVPFDEISEVICLCVPSQCPPLPDRLEPRSWPLPDPSSAPSSERVDAFRATRDELMRRLERDFRARAEARRRARRPPWA